MLVTRQTNVRYLTGFTGSNAQAILSPATSVFFTDGRYTEQSRHEVTDLERVTYLDAFGEPLAEACGQLGIRKLGFEAHDVTVSGLRQLQDKVPEVEFVAVGEPSSGCGGSRMRRRSRCWTRRSRVPTSPSTTSSNGCRPA